MNLASEVFKTDGLDRFFITSLTLRQWHIYLKNLKDLHPGAKPAVVFDSTWRGVIPSLVMEEPA